VSLAQREVGQSPAAGGPRLPARSWASWLVLGCYLLGALALTWRLWASPATIVQLGNISDVDLFAWFMRYDAAAVAHGHLPALVTTALNWPRGVNLMWNTSFLLPGVVLTPVTLLAGPQVSLTLMLTLGFAGSAASLFWVLRRWGASAGAAGLGGAVYGFSPALMTAGLSHYHLQFAVLPPLIIDALLRLVTGRGSPVRNGIWLGLLVTAQIFTGEELLVITAVAGGVLAAVLGLSKLAGHLAQGTLGRLLAWRNLRGVPAQARGAVTGLATAAVLTLLLSGYALYIQFLGPLTEHGSPWRPGHFRNYPGAFVTPPGNLLFHTQASAAYAANDPVGTTEYLAYLGWPLLVILLIAAIRYWRDPKVRLTALTFALLEAFTLGGAAVHLHGLRYPGVLLPWHWLGKAPVLSQVLPDRFSLLAAGLAAAVLAFAFDLARPAARAAWWRRGIPVAVAALAVLPLFPLPLRAAAPPPVPAGWQAAFARLSLPAGAPVLVVPIPWAHASQVMRWEADSGVPVTMNAGYFIGPNKNGQAKAYGTRRIRPVATLVDSLWAGSPVAPDPVTARKLRTDIAYWRPAAVVAVTGRRSRTGRLLTGLLGPPTFQSGQILAWRR
jgi:hypothetical protein